MIDAKIKKKNRGWQIALVLGVASKYICDLKQMELYNFYLYFYFVSFVCYLYTLTLWGEINTEALLLRYGFFNRKSLEIQWKDISSINVKKVLIKEKDAGHGRFNIAYSKEVEYTALIITMYMPLSSLMLKAIQNSEGYSYFSNRLERDQYTHSLMVITEPAISFASFLKEIKPFVRCEFQDEKKDKSRLYKSFNSIFSVLILLVSIYSFFWNV